MAAQAAALRSQLSASQQALAEVREGAAAAEARAARLDAKAAQQQTVRAAGRPACAGMSIVSEPVLHDSSLHVPDWLRYAPLMCELTQEVEALEARLAVAAGEGEQSRRIIEVCRLLASAM